MPKPRRCLLIMVLFLVLTVAGMAADLTLKIIDKEPPKELDASIRATLQSKAVQLIDGDKPVFEYWLVAELPLRSKPESPAKALDAVKQATLIGAVAVSRSQRDYRDDELTPGVYTMRFGLQPQDGNHLGTAEFAYFAVLIPTKLDPSPDAFTDYKRMVKAGSKETASDHPRIVSLRPGSGESDGAPKLIDPLPDHKSVRVTVPAKIADGGEKTSVSFEIVYRGMGHK